MVSIGFDIVDQHAKLFKLMFSLYISSNFPFKVGHLKIDKACIRSGTTRICFNPVLRKPLAKDFRVPSRLLKRLFECSGSTKLSLIEKNRQECFFVETVSSCAKVHRLSQRDSSAVVVSSW